MKKRAWLLQMLSYIFTGLSFHVSTLACVQINFFFLFFCLFKQAASVVPPSAFAQYKGELIISLKFVTPKKQTAEKTKGKKKKWLFLSLALLQISELVCSPVQTKKPGWRKEESCMS